MLTDMRDFNWIGAPTRIPMVVEARFMRWSLFKGEDDDDDAIDLGDEVDDWMC